MKIILLILRILGVFSLKEGIQILIIDTKTLKKINFDKEFVQWAEKNGIRNPFKVKTKIFQDRTRIENNHFSLREMTEEERKEMPTEEEIDNFISMRKEYVKKRLKEEGIEYSEENL